MNNNNENNPINLCWIVVLLLLVDHLDSAFNPNTNNYDAYGVKIGMNEYFLVEAQNNNLAGAFLVQFAPYNTTPSSLQCLLNYPGNSTVHYVYSVVARRNQTQFFFVGQLWNGGNGTFIGVATLNSSFTTCASSFSYSVQYFYNYVQQDYFVVGVDSTGRFAYGFSNLFVCVLDTRNTSTTQTVSGNVIWLDSSFMPHAVDMSTTFGIIAGFIRNPRNTTTVYVPMIYLVNFNASTNLPVVVDQYQPIPEPGTWQDLLTNADANSYAAKYDMSVSINGDGSILVGMQFINRVFLLSVNLSNSSRLTYISRNTNGRQLGNGKSLAWLDSGLAAVLVNTYSLTYQWSASQIYFYNIQNNVYNSNSTPLSVFPNSHQILPTGFSSILLNIVSSPSSVAVMDSRGKLLVINPTPAGYYPSVQDSGTVPVFTIPQSCLAGTYKSQAGIYDCLLCPSGTQNPGNSSTQCFSCSSDSYCPLGSVGDVPHTALENKVQAHAYPQSPESIIFDEILIQNMFHIGPKHCLVVSPLFWALIAGGIVLVLIILMVILKICVIHPQSKKVRGYLKGIFKRVDLIGEGELWVGGLASFAVLVLLCFAYSFSAQFLKQYPIETSGDSNFACDLTLRNAKFQTNILSSSIPLTEAEQAMVDLLNNQIFHLNIDFINTRLSCNVASLQALIGTRTSVLRWSACNNTNSILSLSIPLPLQHLTVQVLLADVQPIGALRIGLSADGSESDRYNLQQLNFSQVFFKSGSLLVPNLPIDLEITKVINETMPMTGEESVYGGLYIPTFNVDANSLFQSADQYVFSNVTLTTLTVSLSETPYYVKNLQQPIAKISEIVFHNLLFTIVCLEIFGLIFLLYKLTFKPLHRVLCPRYFTTKQKKEFFEMHSDSETKREVFSF